MRRPHRHPTGVVRRLSRDPEGHVVLELHGEIDLAVVEELRAAVDDAFTTPPVDLRVEARDVAFIDSTGISALMAAHRRCSELGVPLTILPSPMVQRVFTISGLADLLTTGTSAPRGLAAHD